ncbi:MAG: hypothetical protein ACI9DM_001156 [Cyclobacteriaceae bacterium]
MDDLIASTNSLFLLLQQLILVLYYGNQNPYCRRS